MEFFEREDIKKSLREAQEKELQPFELSISRLVRELGMINLDDQTIINVHRVCLLVDEILGKQFDQNGLR